MFLLIVSIFYPVLLPDFFLGRSIGVSDASILLLAQNENVDGAKALGVESIVSHLIFLILGGLRSFNRDSFRASPNSHFELGGVYTKEWQLENLYLSISSLKIKYLLRLRRLKKITRFMKHRFLHI